MNRFGNATVNGTVAADEAVVLGFSAPVAKTGCSGAWYVTDGISTITVPCANAIAADANSLAMSVVVLDVDLATLAGPKLAVSWDAGVVSDAAGAAVEAGEFPEFLEIEATPAGEPTVVATIPSDGDASFLGSAIAVHFAAPILLNSSALVSLTDCAADDVC